MTSRVRPVLLGILVFGLAVVLGSGVAFTAFRSTSSNAGNAFVAGTVALRDNDLGAAVIDVTNARPGATTACLKVAFAGTLPSVVRLFGSTTGDLRPYINLKIERGSGALTFPSCSAFVIDSANHRGLGAGVLFNGKLSDLPTSFGDAIADPDGSWTPDESRAYRLTTTLVSDDAAQGNAADLVLRFEARNS